MYLLVVAAAYIAYLFDQKVIKAKHLVAVALVGALFLSVIGLHRSNLLDKVMATPQYLMVPVYADSVFSAYPALSVINLYLNGEIQYYTYFSHYFFDSLMMYVPNFVYMSYGASKAGESGILSNWENDHGGFHFLSPEGAYHYLAEAIAAAGPFGIVVISACFAFLLIYMDSLKNKNLFNASIYYSFLGVAAVDLVHEKFSWCFRYFTQNVFAILVFLLIFQVFYYGAAKKKT